MSGKYGNVWIWGLMFGGSALLFSSNLITAAPAAPADTRVGPAESGSTGPHRTRPQPRKARVIVTTDGEQDDLASMHRFIMYTDEFDVAGIVESSSRFHHAGDASAVPPISQVTWLGSDWIHAIIRNYATAYPTLKENDPNYPAPDYLHGVVKVGNISDVGEYAQNTEGSDWIKRILLDNDPRPVYVSVWGGTNTVAAALRSIRDEYYGKPQWLQIYKKVSKKTWVLIDLDQDATYKEYLAKAWPDVNVVMNNRQFSAFAYPWATNVPTPLKSYYEAAFQERMIRKGPIQADYSLAGRRGINPRDWFSEGDSPQFIQQFPIGLSDLENYQPSFGNWGGRYTQEGPHLWVDNPPYLGFGDVPTADYSPYIGAGDFPATTLAQSASAGSNLVRLASVANLSPRAVVTIGSGATAQQREVLHVGSAQAAPTKLSAAATAGSTNIKLDSVAGIGIGDPITIGSGGEQETRIVMRLGKASTDTALSSNLPAGATEAKLGNTANLSVGDSLNIGSGTAAQTVKVTSVGRPSSDYMAARATTTLAGGSATLSEASALGAKELKLAAITGFLKGQTVSIDSGSAQEFMVLDDVGVGGGTTLGLPSVAGSKTVKILSTANFVAGTPVWIDSGANLEKAVISLNGPRYPARGADQEGTRAAGASVLSAPSAVGAHSVKVANVAGFLVGAPITLDSGENAESIHISFVGTAGPDGTGIDLVEPLKRSHSADAPISAAGLTLINALGKSHPTGATVTASGATLSAPLSRSHAAEVNVATITPAGIPALKVTSVAGFEPGETITIDVGANRETAVIASVGTPGLGGTGLRLVSPTKLPHFGPVAIEQVTAPAGATRIKLMNPPPPPNTVPAAGRGGQDGVAAPGGPGTTGAVAPQGPASPNAGAAAGGANPPAGGGFGGRGGAPAMPFALPAISVGDRITIGEGAAAEQVIVSSVGTGGLTGTGISFTPALTRTRDGPVKFHDDGTGVGFMPAVKKAYRAGDAVTAAGTGITLRSALARTHDRGGDAQGLGSGIVLTSPLAAAVSAGDAFHNDMNPYYPQTRWTAAIQNDFAARVDWQIKGYAESNHPPVVSVSTNKMTLAPGQLAILKGSASDPDRNALKFNWWQYREPGTYPGAVTLSGADKQNAQFVVPRDAKPGQTIHLILEVEDSGTPPITRYQRVIVTVAGKSKSTPDVQDQSVRH